MHTYYNKETRMCKNIKERLGLNPQEQYALKRQNNAWAKKLQRVNKVFKPWWNEVSRVYDKTLKEFAEIPGVPSSMIKDRLHKKFEDQEKFRMPLKGYRFGRIGHAL